jgi:hypothetical protein
VKLLRLKVDGFGPLRGEWSFDPDKLNVVVDDNERGKSSLLAAIAAALYGLEDDRRTHRVLTPRERWRPWGGGAFGVELELQAGGRTLTVTRDFERGTATVFDDRGREVTAEFADGRDVLLGQRLLGLDASEFEKCALVRQGELDLVVPGDEKARRASTLRARLETAADTHIGDTNASEAIRVLDEALRHYDAHELDFTGTVDTAIDRLDAKARFTESQIHEIDHRLEHAQEPLRDMATLADEEKAIREGLRQLDEERLASHASELRRQLDEDDANRAELGRLETEAAELELVAHLPPNAEADLRDTVARFEEAQVNLDTLATRRNAEIGEEQSAVERELTSLTPYESYSEDDVNRCIAIAADLRRIALEDASHRRQVFELRDQLASQGYEPERIQFLTARFGSLPEGQQRALRGQSDANLGFQTEVARLEQDRTAASESLRALDSSRTQAQTPAWFAIALGLAGVISGVAMLVMHAAPIVWSALLAGGALVAGAGGALLAMGSRTQVSDREEAMQRLDDAQQRLHRLRTQRAEGEAQLAEIAKAMGYRDSVELMRHWNEYSRMVEDSLPLVRAQDLLASVEAQKRKVLEAARPLLRALGDVPVTPEALERVAHEARRVALARTRLDQLARSDESVDHQRQILEGVVGGLRERAMRILQGAGLTYDPERPLRDHLPEIARRIAMRQRRVVVTEELIPFARQRLMPEAGRHELQRRLHALVGLRDEPAAPRSPVDIDLEVQKSRTRLDEVQHSRAELRLQLESVLKDHAHKRPDLEADLDRVRRALVRAKCFKEAAELARETIQQVAVDTHRRWADFLNGRVGELLERFGTGVDQVRFGEDLDFSVQYDGGPQVSRGKAQLQLSSGARDQLFLAVRLAASEYLSRGGEPLPLLLDDVFATSDDTRLLSGMRALVESFAGGHQVIALTCHRGRHQDLMRAEPEWFRERVRWVDVRANAPARG